MYFESVLLLVSVGLIVPYACFSVVNSLICTADQDVERRYGSKSKTHPSTLVTGKQVSLPAQRTAKNNSAIVKVTKTSAIVKRS